MRENGLFWALLCLLALVALGCLSFGTDTQHEDAPVLLDSTDFPEVSVEAGELEVETLPPGCVDTIDKLRLPSYVKSDDTRLRADRLIVVRKKARRVMLFTNGQLRHDRPGNSPDCWRIGLGWDPVFDKMIEGDGRTPEGLFRTSDKPWSSFYGAITVHYPDERHADQALTAKHINKRTHDRIVSALKKGILPPQTTALGGNILLHGGGAGSDWTAGCVALNNTDLDELRSLLPAGMRTWVLILR